MRVTLSLRRGTLTRRGAMAASRYHHRFYRLRTGGGTGAYDTTWLPALPPKRGMLGRCGLRVQSHPPWSTTDGGLTNERWSRHRDLPAPARNGLVAGGWCPPQAVGRPRLPGQPIVGRPGAEGGSCTVGLKSGPSEPDSLAARGERSLGDRSLPRDREGGSRIQQPSVSFLRRPGWPLVAPRVVIRRPSSFPAVHVRLPFPTESPVAVEDRSFLPPPHHQVRPQQTAGTRPPSARPGRR